MIMQKKKYLLMFNFVALLLGISSSLMAQKKSSSWPVLKTYTGEMINQIAMPIGGVGTGTISLGGRGELRDWEITNRGALGWTPAVKLVEPTIANGPFFAMYYKTPSQKKGSIRLVEGPINPAQANGDWGTEVLNAGFPRFDGATFKAAYPLAQIDFTKKNLPLKVRLEAFNPMIPGDVNNSSLPIACLRYVVKNESKDKMEVSLCGMIPNFIGMDGWGGSPNKNINTYKEQNGLKGLYMSSDGVDKKSVNWGNMAFTTPTKGDVSHRTTWAKLGWNWTFREFLDDFSNDGVLSERGFEAKNNKNEVSEVMNDLMTTTNKYELSTPPATLAVKQTIMPGEEKTFTFYITWYFPNRRGWDHGQERYTPFGTNEIVGNYYCNFFSDAWDVINKLNSQMTTLENRTVAFVSALCNSNIPEVIKEAALFNTVNMRCQTMFRTKDGFPFGFEGTGSITGTLLGADKNAGWGFGTCFHVWNYESAIPFLFGDLAMKFREVEFLHTVNDNGGMSHRVGLPLETKGTSFKHWAADGQMGTLVKIYREWKLSGNDNALKAMWPNIKKSMAFAWTGPWDTNKDGVMEGPQHNTMDIEYHGPNPQMSIWYLAALKASIEMAKYLNDQAFAQECQAVFDKGQGWVDKNLYNGEYYEQIIPQNHNKTAQLGKGCLVDQLVGQYLAHTTGLGYVTNPNYQRKTLQSIYKYNWVDNFNDHTNTFRSFALGDEKGLIMASYPHGELLDFPFPYYTEVMTGFEYSTAVHLIYEGMKEQGLSVFEAIRNRFDGKKRNPFDEGEFGHRYARAMASWAGILAWTGFQYSAIDHKMSFNDLSGTNFWSNGYSFGTINISKQKQKTLITIKVIEGNIKLDSFALTTNKTHQFNTTQSLQGGRELTFEL